MGWLTWALFALVMTKVDITQRLYVAYSSLIVHVFEASVESCSTSKVFEITVWDIILKRKMLFNEWQEI